MLTSAPAQRDGGMIDPHRDRVAAERPLMQNLDMGALDEAELDQAAFDFAGRQAGSGDRNLGPLHFRSSA